MSCLFKAVTVGFLTGVLGLLLSLMPVVFELEENVGLDILFKLRGTRQVPSNVIIVSIDKASAVRLNLPNDPGKWPRSLHARLTESLSQAGAVVIAFDINFDKARSAADDQAFADAIRQARNVVLFEYLSRETVPVTDKRGPPRGTLHIETRVPPIPPLAQAAVALAPFPLPKVPVKVSQYWTFKTGASDTPTLPVVAFQIFALEVYDEFVRLLAQVSPSQAASLPRDREAILTTTGVGEFVRVLRDIFTSDPLLAESMLEASRNAKAFSVDVKKHHILTSLIRMYQSANSQYLNFYGPPGTITTIPYYRVLHIQEESSITQQPLDVHGKAVLVGFSERFRPEQKDGFYTVFSQTSGVDISGVEIAATAFANLLEDTPVRLLGWRGQHATLFLWGLLLGVLCRLLPLIIAAVSALGLGVLYLIAAQHQFTTTGSWYPLLVPLLFQVPLAFFGALLWKYFDLNRERQNVREAFGYYLPHNVIDQLAKSVANVKTGSQLVHGICLFTDAEQYTSLAEAMKPKDLGSFMNAYYATVFEPVRQHGGIVSDVVGDAMLAIWATAQPNAILRNQACLTALAIVSAVNRFKQSFGTVQLPTRIGLHAGSMLLGNIGALDHYEYRAVGDIVNTASRIESLNKFLGTQILVSVEVLHQLSGFLTRELGTFLVVGKSKPLVVHELICRLGESHRQQRSLCALFAEALGAYRRQAWEEAIEKFSEIIRISSHKEDGPSLFYVKLCEQYKEKPPGAAWDGIVHMVRK
jgi:Adenylate cyclase, family 3 (some proteins contain HAMP domain)